MTAIIGVLCQDGVVIGADSSTTFVAGDGNRTIEQISNKIKILHGNVIVTGTGSVGLAQRFHQVIESYGEKGFKERSPIETGKELCRKMIEDMASTRHPMGQYGSLVAFPSGGGGYSLCEFESKSFQPELKSADLWYVSMGCGQQITDTFLGFIRSCFWNSGQPKLSGGILATLWALDLACEVNVGGIGPPITIAILERPNEKKAPVARMLTKDELGEHKQQIEAMKLELRNFPSKTASGAGAAPAPPAPPVVAPATAPPTTVSAVARSLT